MNTHEGEGRGGQGRQIRLTRFIGILFVINFAPSGAEQRSNRVALPVNIAGGCVHTEGGRVNTAGRVPQEGESGGTRSDHYNESGKPSAQVIPEI